jgi:hypothetical protein
LGNCVKNSIGKLKLSFPVANIADYCKKMEFTLLPLEPLDALNSKDCPNKGLPNTLIFSTFTPIMIFTPELYPLGFDRCG